MWASFAGVSGRCQPSLKAVNTFSVCGRSLNLADAVLLLADGVARKRHALLCAAGIQAHTNHSLADVGIERNEYRPCIPTFCPGFHCVVGTGGS